MPQIALHTLHELFEAERKAWVTQIAFNGIVDGVNPASGHQERVCVMTGLVAREAFVAVRLGEVNPAACFVGLGDQPGKSFSAIRALAPIAVPPEAEQGVTQTLAAPSAAAINAEAARPAAGVRPSSPQNAMAASTAAVSPKIVTEQRVRVSLSTWDD